MRNYYPFVLQIIKTNNFGRIWTLDMLCAVLLSQYKSHLTDNSRIILVHSVKGMDWKISIRGKIQLLQQLKDSFIQRVSNVLQNSKVSRGRKIRLHAHPLSPVPSVSVISTGDTQEDWEREKICWRVRGEGCGRGAESYDRQKLGPLQKNSILSG